MNLAEWLRCIQSGQVLDHVVTIILLDPRSLGSMTVNMHAFQ
jgi:hypothetical protein